MARNVKSFGAALARSNKPVQDSTPAQGHDGLSDFVQGMSQMALKNEKVGIGTPRDQRLYTTYQTVAPQNRVLLENIYRHSWLGRRIICTLPEDMLRQWRAFKWDGVEDADNDVKQLKRLEKKLKVKKQVLTAITWARLYGGALIIPVLKSQDDGVMAEPLDLDDIQKDDLVALQVVDRWRCSHDGNFDQDPSSPQFGMPTHYLLAESAVRLHHTRVIRFDGRKLPYWLWKANAMWDDSVLQILINNLKQYDTATAALATMMFQMNIDVISQEGLRKFLGTKGGAEQVTNRFLNLAMMKSFAGVAVIDKDTETFERKPYTFAGVDKAYSQLMYDVCGAADVPFTRLFGQSPAGMNSTGESDTRNYYDHVAARREESLDGPMDELDQFLVRSALGTMPEDYESEWNPLWQESAKEQADAELVRAQTATAYQVIGAIDEGIVAADLYARGVYPGMTKKDVKLAQELAKQPDPVPLAINPKTGQPMVPKPGKSVQKQLVTPPKGAGEGEDA
jgi:phage-related protein (TIGR01555 family)